MIRNLSVRNADRPFTVDEVVLRVKNLIEYDEFLAHIAVEGELTDLKRHVSGHVYFALKGKSASMNCVMFRSDAQGMLLWPEVGDRVLVTGAVRLYEARGTVQIYAKKMFPLGQSAAARAKEELRRRLEREGLFDPGRKRKIPAYPSVVACVTSDTGAAVRDVMRQRANRFPAAQLIVVPTLVQGLHAAENLTAALRRAAAVRGVDVILLVRGGGAKEDLNPFDNEDLVREVARCTVPVVTGIGHEIDESLCDLAADMHQPPPTAAAAAVFPDRLNELAALKDAQKNVNAEMVRRLEAESACLENILKEMNGTAERRLQESAVRLDAADDRLKRNASSAIAENSLKLSGFKRALDNLSPVRLARRGYSLVRIDGQPLLKAAQASAGAVLTVQMLDGDVNGIVQHMSKRS